MNNTQLIILRDTTPATTLRKWAITMMCRETNTVRDTAYYQGYLQGIDDILSALTNDCVPQEETLFQ